MKKKSFLVLIIFFITNILFAENNFINEKKKIYDIIKNFYANTYVEAPNMDQLIDIYNDFSIEIKKRLSLNNYKKRALSYIKRFPYGIKNGYNDFDIIIGNHIQSINITDTSAYFNYYSKGEKKYNKTYIFKKENNQWKIMNPFGGRPPFTYNPSDKEKEIIKQFYLITDLIINSKFNELLKYAVKKYDIESLKTKIKKRVSLLNTEVIKIIYIKNIRFIGDFRCNIEFCFLGKIKFNVLKKYGYPVNDKYLNDYYYMISPYRIKFIKINNEWKLWLGEPLDFRKSEKQNIKKTFLKKNKDENCKNCQKDKTQQTQTCECSANKSETQKSGCCEK
jgi:hypothetical protein